MGKQTKLSVLTPAMSLSDDLIKTIESVRAHASSQVEHIVAIAGSQNEASELQARFPGLALLTNGFVSEGSALNACLKRASGEYIGVLNPAQEYTEQTFPALWRLIGNKCSYECIYGKTLVRDKHSRHQELHVPLGSVSLWDSLRWWKNRYYSSSIFLSPRLMRSVGSFASNFTFEVFYEFFVRSAALNPDSAYLDVVLSEVKVDKVAELNPQTQVSNFINKLALVAPLVRKLTAREQTNYWKELTLYILKQNPALYPPYVEDAVFNKCKALGIMMAHKQNATFAEEHFMPYFFPFGSATDIRGMLAEWYAATSTDPEKAAADFDTALEYNQRDCRAAHEYLEGQRSFVGVKKITPAVVTPAKGVSYKKILLLRSIGLSDAITTLALTQGITAKYPQTKLTIVCPNYLVPVFRTVPNLSKVIQIDETVFAADRQYTQHIINKIQEEACDLCLNPSYVSDPQTPIMAATSGIPQQAAFDTVLLRHTDTISLNRGSFFNKLVPVFNSDLVGLGRYKKLLEAVGLDGSAVVPHWFEDPADESLVQRFFEKYELNPDKTIAIFSASHDRGPGYPLLGESLAVLLKNQGYSLIGLGYNEESKENEQQLLRSGLRYVNLCGRTSLHQAAAILRRCCLAIGLEGALVHLACAVGTPNVVIQGGGEFSHMLPYSDLTTVVCLPLNCYGCRWHCRFTTRHCINDIAPDVLFEAIKSALNSNSISPRIYVAKRVLSGESAWKLPDELKQLNCELIISD